MLSDNGAVFTAAYRGGIGAMESELCALGIVFRHSRPYHPQTCGKVERFHQTEKKFLAKQDAPTTIRSLQTQLDRFVNYYNTVRPHRSLNRRAPIDAFTARTTAHPRLPGIAIDGYRLRHDKIDRN
jgi:transposase InsO family protein